MLTPVQRIWRQAMCLAHGVDPVSGKLEIFIVLYRRFLSRFPLSPPLFTLFPSLSPSLCWSCVKVQMWLATCVAFRYTRMVFLSYEGISICLEVREFATLHKFIGFVRGFLPLLLLLLLLCVCCFFGITFTFVCLLQGNIINYIWEIWRGLNAFVIQNITWLA